MAVGSDWITWPAITNHFIPVTPGENAESEHVEKS